MRVDNILPDFGLGLSGYYEFETFVLNLLKLHIESQNKKFSVISDSVEGGTAYAESGFDSFDGPTLIELKPTLTRLRISDIFKLIDKWSYPAPKHILFITSSTFSSSIHEKVLDDFALTVPDTHIAIWGSAELERLVRQHRKDAIKIVNNLFKLRIENVVSKPRGQWKEDRERIVRELAQSYVRGQFAFFLGAGVSSSAGMPDWNTLLNSLFVSYLVEEFTQKEKIQNKDLIEIVERLNEVDAPSTLTSARYLRKGLSKETTESNNFIRSVTQALYQLRDINKPLASPLLKVITKLCMPKRSGAKVRAVVTYNFDDLLERQLTDNSIQHHCIYSEAENYHPDELPVYHVHGFLPEESANYENLSKSTLVFSEEGYHQIYTDAYHWSNLVQLNNLREYNCLMVGLSMADPNLRRLLDISAKNLMKPRHFAFLRRISLERFLYTTDSKGHKQEAIKNVLLADEFLEKHHNLNEQIMKELGISVIWFEDFDDIPEILNSISTKS